ncbi:beta-ketoacyl-ACP reductase [Halobacteriales archaeon QS_8_69_26]|nr:MAG: beta-ketoacyl-ACP reductase [Halobacteriales archaeon QS_8_69_26]
MDDRTCVITGSARGIGRGIAETLAQHGANVVINYRSSEDAALAAVEGIESMVGEGSAMAVQADVTDRDALEEMRRKVNDEYGQVHVLINNAGINRDTRFVNMTPDEWTQVLEVNLGGTFNATQIFFDDVWNAEEGRLINISSVVGKQGNFGQANYAAAKSGMFGFTRTLALELAPGGSTANCVAPGFTKTDMLESVPEDVRENIVAQIPLGRFAEIEDIACVVRFLASEESSYVTGEVIDINGGMDL